MRAGLPPAARLRRAADFEVLRHAQGRLALRFFKLRWSPSPTGTCRLGLAVSRKVSTSAVVRNRIKRVVRETFRTRRAQLPPLDVLVIAAAGAASAGNQALRIDLERAWRALPPLKPLSAPGTIDG